MKIGELCAGYGGLGMGVKAVLGGDIAWVSDIDPGANKILAHRFPGVPNIGDMTTVDWSQVEPVDVLTGGTPCQDLSHAGKRAGMTEGTRSNLWVAMREAVAQLRPGLVVWENVRGAYSAEADSEMGWCDRCLVRHQGGGKTLPALRALGRVLGDLADLGYDARWHGLRAADVGAPHGRFRVFVVAYPAADSERLRRGPGWDAAPGEAASRWSSAIAGGPDRVSGTALLPTPAVNDMGEGKTPEAWDEWTAKMQAAHGNGNGYGKSLAIEAQRLLPAPTSRDSAASGGSTPLDITLTDAIVRTDLGAKENPRHVRASEAGPGEELRDVRSAAGSQAIREASGRPDALPVEAELFAGVWEPQASPDALGTRKAGSAPAGRRVRTVPGDDSAARPSQGPELGERRPGEPADAVRVLPLETALAGGPGAAHGCCEAGRRDGACPWGMYSAAVHRWEMVLGRVAPPPTVLSRKGTPQLSARFSEFLMGLPEGWVTDVPGVSRNEALKAIGNGVVPQQCAAALRFLLGAEMPTTQATTARLLPTPRAGDGEKGGPNQRGSSGDLMLPSAVTHLTGGAA